MRKQELASNAGKRYAAEVLVRKIPDDQEVFV